MIKVNPFPQYPVSQLDESPEVVERRTWVTEPIRQERTVIANWIRQPEKPMIVAVLGEYGSGKTHLLLDAMTTLRRQLDAAGREYGFVPVVGLAERPLGWYRAEIGPRLAALPIAGLVIKLYAEAGKEVASRAGLTEAAVGALDRKPERIFGLVRGDLLSSTEVEAVFQDNLRAAVPDAHPEILQALSWLRWPEADTAMLWLAGGKLSPDQAAQLELSASIDSDERAFQVLLAVAAIHYAGNRVFALFVDEAEHFLETDGGSGQGYNVTSMKRLLEGLARRHAVAFIAGHSSAWETLRDYHDRFSPPTPIELTMLTGDQVRLFVANRVPEAPDFGADQAALVAQLGNGNMRSVTSLLRELYEQSPGFASPFSIGQIEAAAETIGQRPKPATIILRVYELLESLGFTVARRRTVAGAEFDLVAFLGNRPQVVVTLKHASHEIAQGEQVRRLIDQMRDVNVVYPETVGCFLSEGRLDEAVRGQLNGSSTQRIVLTGVTGPEFIADLSSQLLPLLEITAAPGDLSQLDQRRLEAIGNLDRLQSAREEGLNRLIENQMQDNKVANDTSILSPKISSADYRDRLSIAYGELTRPASLSNRLSRIWYPPTFAAALCVGLGLFAAIFTIAQGSIVTYGAYDDPLVTATTILQYLVSFLLIFAGLFVIIRDFIRIERFYEYRNRRLRSIYLRSEDPDELIDLSDLLQDMLDRYGPRWSNNVPEAGP